MGAALFGWIKSRHVQCQELVAPLKMKDEKTDVSNLDVKVTDFLEFLLSSGHFVGTW